MNSSGGKEVEKTGEVSLFVQHIDQSATEDKVIAWSMNCKIMQKDFASKPAFWGSRRPSL